MIPCVNRMVEVLKKFTNDDLTKEAKNVASYDAFPSLFRVSSLANIKTAFERI